MCRCRCRFFFIEWKEDTNVSVRYLNIYAYFIVRCGEFKNSMIIHYIRVGGKQPDISIDECHFFTQTQSLS